MILIDSLILLERAIGTVLKGILFLLSLPNLKSKFWLYVANQICHARW